MAVRKVLRAEWQRCKAMKAVFVQRDEKSAKAKTADLVRSFQPRFGKAMEISKPASTMCSASSLSAAALLAPPHAGACIRLIGTPLFESHEDWLTDDKAYLTWTIPPKDTAGQIVPDGC